MPIQRISVLHVTLETAPLWVKTPAVWTRKIYGTSSLARMCWRYATPMAKFEELYAQLKHIARRELAKHAASTLNTTGLLHEAFIKLAESDLERDRAHLIALVTRVMRQVLVDQARARLASKRERVAHGEQDIATAWRSAGADEAIDLIAFDESLRQLAASEPRMSQALELAFFAGLEAADIAAHLGVNVRTVQRDLLAARTLLQVQLQSAR